MIGSSPGSFGSVENRISVLAAIARSAPPFCMPPQLGRLNSPNLGPSPTALRSLADLAILFPPCRAPGSTLNATFLPTLSESNRVAPLKQPAEFEHQTGRRSPPGATRSRRSLRRSMRIYPASVPASPEDALDPDLFRLCPIPEYYKLAPARRRSQPVKPRLRP